MIRGQRIKSAKLKYKLHFLNIQSKLTGTLKPLLCWKKDKNHFIIRPLLKKKKIINDTPRCSIIQYLILPFQRYIDSRNVLIQYLILPFQRYIDSRNVLIQYLVLPFQVPTLH